jgi:hypothetical protein
MLFVFIASVFVSNLHAMDLPPQQTNLVLDEANIEKILDNFIQDIQIKPHWFYINPQSRAQEIERIKNEIKGALLQNLKRNTLRVNSIEEHLKLLSYCLNNWNLRDDQLVGTYIEYFLPLSQEDLESMAQLGKSLEHFIIVEPPRAIMDEYFAIRPDFRQKSVKLFEHVWHVDASGSLFESYKIDEPFIYAMHIMREVKNICLSCENIDQLQEKITSYENWRSFYNWIPTPVSSTWNYLFPWRIPQ